MSTVDDVVQAAEAWVKYYETTTDRTDFNYAAARLNLLHAVRRNQAAKNRAKVVPSFKYGERIWV